MRIKKNLFLLIGTLIVISLAFSGCYELGDGTENDEDYRATYSEIRLIDGNGAVHYYSMSDFFNDEAVNDFKSPLSEADRSEYSYILIKSEKDLSLGEIAVYFDSTVEAVVSVDVFILDEDAIPTKVYSGEDEKFSLSECDEPDLSERLANVTFRVPGTPNKWKEFYLKRWGVGDSPTTKRHSIESGQYIVLRIANNCYDPAKKMLDQAENAFREIEARYAEKAAALQTVNHDPSATSEQKEAALRAFQAASREKTESEAELNAAKKRYEAERNSYSTKVPLRLTAILINAE